MDETRRITKKQLKKYCNRKENKIERFIFQKTKNEQEYKKIAYDILGKLSIDKNFDIEDESFWESSFYRDIRDEVEKKTLRIKIKPESTKGLYKCRVKDCDSDEFYVWTAATRSGDEGMTHFARCKFCGNQIKH